MTDREIIEDFKDLVEESRQEDIYEYYYKLLNVLNLIQKQDTEINKLNDERDKWKLKVEEKIEELGDIAQIGNDLDYMYFKGQYELLQELLEEYEEEER